MRSGGFKPGTRVTQTMGIRQSGTVLQAIPHYSGWTDGQYRYPQTKREWRNAVGVRWDDGTQGWIFKAFLESGV
jgi:hypothetical protein